MVVCLVNKNHSIHNFNILVDLAKRLNSKQPRYLEKEGLYVGTYPPVYKKCLNKLQHRLLKANEL